MRALTFVLRDGPVPITKVVPIPDDQITDLPGDRALIWTGTEKPPWLVLQRDLVEIGSLQ